MGKVVFTNMILHFFRVFLLLVCAQAQAPSCCSNIKRHQTCRYHCQQLLPQGSATQQMQQLLTAAKHCPPNLVEFWQCVNSSLPVLSEIAVWTGRPCCHNALSSRCQRHCSEARLQSDVESTYCAKEPERQLYRCLHRHSVGEKCCQYATSNSCSVVCHSFFLTGSTATRSSRDVVLRHCRGSSPLVASCIQNQTQSARASNPKEKIPCCDKAPTTRCRQTCIQVLQTSKTDDDIIDEVIKACGPADMRESLWQCFLLPPSGQKNETPPATTGLDSARLQCCAKAGTDRCRELCTETYNKGMSQHWSEFHNRCSYVQPVSRIEVPMHNCLTDVESPCKLGCSKLKFCSNFNHRPTEHFRSCSSQADTDAENTIKHWQKGTISLPQMTIRVKDIHQCEPEMWKAIACALQIKPCHRKPNPLSLCQEDCMYILNKCVDHSHLSQKQTIPQLCNTLPKQSEPGACIAVSQYLMKSPHIKNEGEVTNPCNPNPCETNYICQIRRRKCKHHDDCKPYICKAACLLGQVSTFLVPRGVFVRIPGKQSNMRNENCFSACRCSHRNVIENCRPLPCVEKKKCNIGPGHIREHGSQFLVDGSHCICHSGQLICAKRTTCSLDKGLSSGQFTGMPANCPAHYMPVCGQNGKTYPNSCLARCADVRGGFRKGACSSKDPCHSHTCGEGYRCVTRRQVCVSLRQGEDCPQYECIAEDSSMCNPHYHDSVCDTTGEEFTNACILFNHRQELAYRGHCMENCAKTGTVCGHNGETYSSECAALADRSTIDYLGECRAVGNMSADAPRTASCGHIQCPSLRPKYCHGVTPPGACCPICASELQALFDPRLANAAAAEMGRGPLTVKKILDMLSDHLMVAECDVFGYLSVEGFLVVLIAPVTQMPTELQVEACNSEAGRLEHLIQTGSPTLMSYLMLTPLLLAPVRTSSVHYTSTGSAGNTSLWLQVMLLLVALTITQRKL